MSRIIKFRVWQKTLKKMSYDLDENSLGWLRTSKACIPMQFTGLKDKNGKEAFEGDIYTCGYKRSDGSHKYGDRNIIKDIRTFDPEDEFEIIGNCFENPELLK